MSEEVQTPVEPVVETQTPIQPVTEAMKYVVDGKFTQEFRDSLPDDLGKHSSFEKYENAVDYFKGSINSSKLNGQKAEEFWKSEDPTLVAERNVIMGVPSDASGYEVEVGDIPEGMPFSEDRLNEVKAFALENNIPAEYVKKMIEWDLEGAKTAYAEMQTNAETQRNDAEDALRQEWKGDKYDYNISKSKNALEHLGLGHWADDPAFGNNTAFIQDVFNKIVPLISDDTIIEARQSENLSTIQDSLSSVEDKMFATPQDKLHTSEYSALVTQRNKLLEKIT